MARFDTSGFDDLIDDIAAMGDDTEEMFDAMLEAGTEEIVKARKEVAKKHNLIDTGSMIENMKGTKIGGTGLSAEIYSRGKDKKGVKNAEKESILHFGVSSNAKSKSAKSRRTKSKRKYPNGIPATHWVDEADALGRERAIERMERVHDEVITKHGL